MENVVSASSRKETLHWIVSFVIWFLVPLGMDKFRESISRRDYGIFIGTLLVAALLTYFISLTRRKTAE